MIELTQTLVRELLHYVPETGFLYWKERDVKWFADVGHGGIIAQQKRWNKANAGRIAGSIDAKSGYRRVRILNKNYKASRVIWLWVYGVNPKLIIDHKNGIKDDNQLENLCEATFSENAKNRTLSKNNTSGFVGVSYSQHAKKWTSQITKKIGEKTKVKNLGYFDSAEEAFRAYVKEARLEGYSERHIFSCLYDD